MDFPYLIIQPGLYGPMLTLEVWNLNGNWTSFEAYVDSGATYSIFDADSAAILGLEITQGRKSAIIVGDGNRIPVYLFQLPVRFSGHSFRATIGFSKKLGVGFNLLGRHSFFNHFRICFNDKERLLQTTYLG